MKRKLTFWFLALGMAASFALPQSAGASGACTAARFHDWNDMGCNQNCASAGTPPKGGCPPCNGMPQWWVSEPYINLCMADTPLSYKMSSGKEMDFTFYYRQRAMLPDSDEVVSPGYNSLNSLILPIPTTPNCGTNASWGNNWTVSVTIWDYQWETNWRPHNQGGSVYYTPPGSAPYSQGYQALVWRPEGGINYFNGYVKIGGAGPYPVDPVSLTRLEDVSGLGYPVVEESLLLGATNVPTADANGIFWGDPGIGVKLVYPDGSQDVFGLPANFIVVKPITTSTPPTGTSTTRLLLTQRIDAQGRVSRLGYEQLVTTGFVITTNSYRVRYVVDPDGRTNTFYYTTSESYQISQINDPYGRQTSIGYSSSPPTSGLLNQITDAAGNSSSFDYPPGPKIPVTNQITRRVTYIYGTSSGWITNLSTPYGKTAFSHYHVADPNATKPDCDLQRAIYVSEPEGANQLFDYEQFNSLINSTGAAPANISGQSFDDGNSGSTEYHPLQYRNTFHWDRRQFAALSQPVQYYLSAGDLTDALTYLTTQDYNKADLKHWLLTGDSTDAASSITESLSSEQDPSPDAAGQIPGLRTWYNYAGKPSGERLGSNPQVSCVARILPDGTSQYTTYNYYSQYYPYGGAGFVSDNESSYSRPDGSIGVLTNWFAYAAKSVDLVSVSNSAGQYVNLGYNGSHQITSITNALNQVTALSWGPNLTGIQWASGQSVNLTYYGNGGYWTNIDPNGGFQDVWVSVPTPNDLYLQNITWSPSGRSYTINSYSAGFPASVTDDRGVSVTNSWDGLNRLTGTTFPDGSSISNVYYRLDRVAAKDRLGNWTLFGYDGLQHLTVITNASLAATFLDWCGCGSLNHIYDAQNGTSHPTTLNYDNQGSLTNIVFPDSTSLTYQYDLAGRMFNAYDGAGKSLQFGYNNQGLVTNVIGAYGSLQKVIYDAVNRPISVTDANGVTVTNTYDAINELLSRKWTDGIGEGFGYSAAGLIAYTNRDGQFTHYGLDNAGRVTSVTNANTEAIQLGYDSLDNVNSLIDGLLHQTTWQYNEYGWLTNKTDSLTRNAFRFAYNANGWVTNRWTPEKGNTGYTYDNVGNLKTISYPQSSISYAYDALNRLTNVVSGFFTNSFGYTPAGQLAVEKGPWANDAVSNVYSQTLRMSLNQLQPSGSWAQTSYGYDSVWRMQSLASPAGSFGYTFNGAVSPLIKTITLPNTAWITNHYDSLAQLDYTGLANSSGNVFDGYSYMRDALGLRTNVVRDFGLMKSSAGAGYDKIGQITSWTGRETNGTLRLNEQLGWAYDAADNLHLRTNNALVQTFTVDAANELTSVSRSGTLTVSGNTPAPASSVTVNGQAAQTYADFTFAKANNTLANGQNNFTNVAVNPYGIRATNILTVNLPVSQTLLYDNNGNLTNDGVRVFGYDSENQLTNVSVSGSWKSDFVYDGLGRRRIARDYSWNGSAWTKTNEVRYVFDGYLPVQERDSNNVVTVTYTRGTDLSGSIGGAGGIGGLLARTDGNGSTFYHADGAGNVTGLMDGNQYMVGRYLYDPFGKLIGKWGSMADANAMRFSSMPFYRNAGIVGYLGRGYEPNFERFLNQDPIQEAGGINLYQFVGNNPINRIDPLGLYVQYTTASGMTYVIGEGYGDLIGALQGAINSGDSITELKISGHGDDNFISLDPYGNNILVGTDNGILTGDGQDITKLLNGALAPNAKVYLNGCHTARGNDNLAQQMSRLLPGRTVAGQRGFAFGLTGNIGYNINGERYELDIGGLESLPAGRVIGRKGYYQNGNLVGKGWLWNGF